MELEFKDKHIQKLCEDSAHAIRKLGDPCARKLRTRIAEIQAAAVVTELIAGKPHPLKGTRNGQSSVELHGGSRLVFEPRNPTIPTRDDGSIEWSKVTRVRIVYISDYHD